MRLVQIMLTESRDCMYVCISLVERMFKN